MIRSIVLPLCLLFLVNGGIAQEYNREVLPILSEYCFSCHGFDAKARQASLRLDVAEGALAEADSGMPAIVPFQPNQSELMRRIDSTDEDDRMPPPQTGKQLSTQQSEVLRNWIAGGAKYQRHWSFEPPPATTTPNMDAVAHTTYRLIQSPFQ